MVGRVGVLREASCLSVAWVRRILRMSRKATFDVLGAIVPKYFHPAECCSVPEVKLALSYPPLHQNPGAPTIDQHCGGCLQGIHTDCVPCVGFLVGGNFSFVRHVICSDEGFEIML